MEAYSEVIFIPCDCITCCKLVGYIEYAYNEVKLPSLAHLSYCTCKNKN